MFVHANSKHFFVLICYIYMTVRKISKQYAVVRICIFKTFVGPEGLGKKTFKIETQ
jgi:hypothetical protein